MGIGTTGVAPTIGVMVNLNGVAVLLCLFAVSFVFRLWRSRFKRRR